MWLYDGEEKYPSRVKSEEQFVDWDFEMEYWGVFGEESGHCYAQYETKEEAQAFIDKDKK
jgi:hypothetical protein